METSQPDLADDTDDEHHMSGVESGEQSGDSLDEARMDAAALDAEDE